jgi:HK97 family phage major capsid protein
MSFQHYNLETKSAAELSDEDGIAEVKTALDNLTKDINTKTAPFADLEKRLAAAEAKLARPNIQTKAATSDEAKELEAKALNSFLRNGAAGLDETERKTLNIGTGSAGGFVTAPEFSTVIVNKLTQFSPVRSVASVMSIGAGKVFIPVGNADLAGGWVTEVGARPSSDASFAQVEIDANEHAVVVPVSAQLMEDSFVDLQSYLAGQIAVKFAKAEATAFVNGDGSGKPTGFMNTPANYGFVTAAADGSDIIAAVIDAFYTLPGAYAANGSWFLNRQMQGVIRAAADNTTKGTLWSDSLANGTPATLLGRPVYDAPDMAGLPSATGTAYPIAFGDFKSAYQIVDRIGVQILRDDFTGADNGIVKIRARRRVGGAPILTEAVVLVKSVHA